ncbi:hypothetical protein [Geomonas propionica]|uniref:AbiTii domain-containing protein n=1 Tax=Geomonas propionica TaxID=2798582 RepID=A0ABS0YT79_9BACT|nr:hypothetical protein [Geomonas propionica]MBJ6801138.1 hypothetical protein [Geomonas propionica]
MTDQELIPILEKLKNIMISVATGGQRIQVVNQEYLASYQDADVAIKSRGIENPNPYSDLWEWYGRWSSGDLPTYQSRRLFLSELYAPLLKELRDRAAGDPPKLIEETTGWPKVDRTIGEARMRLAEAENEEQFQAVGLLCREALISLAQSVFDPHVHKCEDGVTPSETDAKRMLSGYISSTLEGRSNEVSRKHARAAYDLAVELQHRRTADFRQAALCVEATTSVINVMAIISGRRDPCPF